VRARRQAAATLAAQAEAVAQVHPPGPVYEMNPIWSPTHDTADPADSELMEMTSRTAAATTSGMRWLSGASTAAPASTTARAYSTSTASPLTSSASSEQPRPALLRHDQRACIIC
jgi:hypothetical protein